MNKDPNAWRREKAFFIAKTAELKGIFLILYALYAINMRL